MQLTPEKKTYGVLREFFFLTKKSDMLLKLLLNRALHLFSIIILFSGQVKEKILLNIPFSSCLVLQAHFKLKLIRNHLLWGIKSSPEKMSSIKFLIVLGPLIKACYSTFLFSFSDILKMRKKKKIPQWFMMKTVNSIQLNQRLSPLNRKLFWDPSKVGSIIILVPCD